MDKSLYMALEEWARLESDHHRAQSNGDIEGAKISYAAVLAKEMEILDMHAQTKDEALAHLRFCANYLEMRCDRCGRTVTAIRNAVRLLSWT
jgi:uncharacterized metal-binding protein YceD (DUF177 family)